MAKDTGVTNPTPEEELAALQAKVAALEAEKQALLAVKTDATGVTVNGTFRVEGETTTGKDLTGTYGFAPGHVGVRLKEGWVAPSEQLIALANGTHDADTLHPALAGETTESAKAWLTKLVEKGASFLVKVSSVFALFVMFSLGASAQIRSGYNETFSKVSMTNTDTTYFTPSRTVTDDNTYESTWQLVAPTGNTGTTKIFIAIQERLVGDNDAWVTTDTVTLKSTKRAIFFTRTLGGTQQRVMATSTGTQVQKLLGAVRYRRRLS